MTTTDHIATAMARAQEAFKAKPAQTTQSEAEHARVVQALRQAWNAPARHADATPSFVGEWGATLNSFAGRLNSGALMALVGVRGCGKTQLAVELMRCATGQRRSALFTTATAFFMQIKATYKQDSKETEESVITRFQKPSLLVIDEIGKRGETDWENNLLFELVNRRYNAMKDTLLIDNRRKIDFVQAIGESMASRMNEGGGIKECNWESFRLVVGLVEPHGTE